MATPLKYSDRLAQSQQDKDQQDRAFQVEQAELQLQSDILATKRSLTEANSTLNTLKGAANFNSSAIIEQQGVVEGLQNGLKALEKLQKELF